MAQAFVSQYEPSATAQILGDSFERGDSEVPASCESPIVFEPGETKDEPLAAYRQRIHRRLAPIVKKLVFALLGPDQERDDVTHEIFIRIFLGLSRLRDPERLEQWAARVAINTVKNELRRRRLRRFVSWDPLLEPDRLVSHTDFDARSLALRAARAMDQLPERERALLLRRWFQSTTTDMLAVDAACSARTIKRRLHRAQTRFDRVVKRDASLASWLEDHGVTDDEEANEGV
jgi:RNA polymerase sigma-70 factor (ECF subfamily)